jgi:nucleoside-diphosphate kinase
MVVVMVWLSAVQARGYKLCALKMLVATPELITQHYDHIKDKDFFPSVRGSVSGRGRG